LRIDIEMAFSSSRVWLRTFVGVGDPRDVAERDHTFWRPARSSEVADVAQSHGPHRESDGPAMKLPPGILFWRSTACAI
jgi:hypothetical protein